MYYFTEKLKSTLDRIVSYPITVIEAGSGYGKSTAVHEYLFHRFSESFRQVCVTCMEGQAGSSWKLLCRELGGVDSQIGQYLDSLSLTSVEDVESMMLQMQYLTCEEPTIFCIDNYQLLEDVDRDQLIQAFSLHRCKNLHLVVMTQPYRHTEKAFFARYPYYYISADAFIFDRTDIQQFAQQEGLRLKPEELDLIWKTTEGYAAAIRLQLESFKQSGHFEVAPCMDVLIERVLWAHRSEREKQWLLCLSAVDEFSLGEGSEICKAQEARGEFQEFLEQIDFIRWKASSRRYGFHNLLLTFVRDRFDELSLDEQRNIWLRAAKAKAHSGDSLTAAKLYGRCGVWKALTELPFGMDDRVELVHMDDGAIVRQLIQPENRHLLMNHPELILSLTLELYVQGCHMLHIQYLEAVKEIMKQPERYGHQRGAELQGEFCLLQSFLVYNDVQEMCRYHRTAWEYMKRPTKLYSLHTAWTFGMPSVAGMFWREAGRLEAVLQEVKTGMPLYYQLSEGNGMGAHHAMEGEVYLLRGNTGEAEESYHKALYGAEKLGQDSICYCAYLGLAKAAIFEGKVATYTHMQENLDDRPYIGKESRCIYTTDVCKGYLAILLGQWEEVPAWLWDGNKVRRKTLMPAQPYVRSIYVRLLLEQLRRRMISYEGFRKELHDLIAECHRFRVLLPEVYAWIFLAVAADWTGKAEEAGEYLKKAFELCFEDEVSLPFVECYDLIKPLLERLVLPKDMQEWRYCVIQLSERFRKGKSIILDAMTVRDTVLTPREREIAGLLKGRMSVKEIAEKLSISPSTVSNMMQSIYTKLGIHSKRELYYRDDI